MAYIKNLYDLNFIEYASYVIKDRAIPHINDGLKPVQRRILHTWKWMTKFHKVANVVGQCMRYHPHGDASVVMHWSLWQQGPFIDKQVFVNIYTGDPASAVRSLSANFHNWQRNPFQSEITSLTPRWKKQEPVTLLPNYLYCLQCRGIAVGMATKIMPHISSNCLKQIACLRGEQLLLYGFSSGVWPMFLNTMTVMARFL